MTCPTCDSLRARVAETDEKTDVVHWKTRRTLLAERDRLRAVIDGCPEWEAMEKK